jgi:hypothetical protein
MIAPSVDVSSAPCNSGHGSVSRLARASRSDAGGDDEIVVDVVRSRQYRASCHPRKAAIMASDAEDVDGLIIGERGEAT